MTIEETIRSLYLDWHIKEYGSGSAPFMCEDAFIAGYMACMNGLEYAATLPDNGTERVAYFLPEGVTKP